MKVMTGSEMTAFDSHCIHKRGVPGMLLMEHAGHLIAKGSYEKLSKEYSGARGTSSLADSPKRILVLCGPGNNGGDGLVAARHLHRWGMSVAVLMLKEASFFTDDSLLNYDLLRTVTGIEPQVLQMSTVEKEIASSDLVIDALFGTGLKGALKGLGRAVVSALNDSVVPVVSVDIPSGLSSDDGLVFVGEDGRRVAVKASSTITMGLPKLGFFGSQAAEYTGDIIVADIGFPQRDIAQGLKGRKFVDLMVGATVKSLLGKRKRDGHKGTFGRVMIVGGSNGMAGAVALSARSALRAGAGLVTVGVPASIQKDVALMVPEATTFPLPESRGAINKEAISPIVHSTFGADAVLIGPGIGRSKETMEFISDIVAKLDAPLILDADALYCEKLSMQTRFRSKATFMTPHEGEARQILSQIKADDLDLESMAIGARIRRASLVSRHCDSITVLKGFHTLISDSEGNITINPTGNSGMATGGSGDVLAGVLAALIASEVAAGGADSSVTVERGRSLAAAAAYIHGLAGDICADRVGEYSLTALELSNTLGAAFKVIDEFKSTSGAYPHVSSRDRISMLR